MTGRYTVTYAPRASRDLRRLPEKIATACVEFIRTVLADDPYRVGKPLASSWEGYYSARRSEWRIIDRVDDHQVLTTTFPVTTPPSARVDISVSDSCDDRRLRRPLVLGAELYNLAVHWLCGLRREEHERDNDLARFAGIHRLNDGVDEQRPPVLLRKRIDVGVIPAGSR